MIEKDTGGPAFPQNVFTPMPGGGGHWSHHGGMTLRDWFAGQALAGFIAVEGGLDTFEIDAATAYRWADAMMEARK